MMSPITSDSIFNSYIDDECPWCGAYKSEDDHYGEQMSGGKTMALNFECHECNCKYIVGFGRDRMPIDSEILVDGKEAK
ncbi:MAG: hypothetical protein GY941_22480 [Planctomycetes bacterium]|nr:hypothetical protein [Planctomycetota bacterium]